MVEQINCKEHVATFTKCTPLDWQRDVKCTRINGRPTYIEIMKQGATFIGNLFKFVNGRGEQSSKRLLQVGMAIQHPEDRFDRKIGIEVAAERSWSGETVVEMLVDKHFTYDDFIDFIQFYYINAVKPGLDIVKTEQELNNKTA